MNEQNETSVPREEKAGEGTTSRHLPPESTRPSTPPESPTPTSFPPHPTPLPNPHPANPVSFLPHPKKAPVFDAFISYSHAADGTLAAALQQGLHRFAKPLFKLRAIRVFRDETTLAMTPRLWPEIEKALRSSRFFILMADPLSAQSEWVQKEVACWLDMGRADHMLIVWTGGEVAWNKAKKDFDWDRNTALPPTLAGVFKSEEPLYQDLRWAREEVQLSRKHPRFVTVLAKLSAAIRGRSLDEMFGDDVREQRRSRRFLKLGITILLLATAFAGWRWWGEMQARQEAQTQTKAAEKARDQSDGLINFMLFDLRDKLQPIGRLNVLDDVVKKAKEYLDSLSKELLTPSRLRQRAVMLQSLGDVLVAQGKLPEAMGFYQQILPISKGLVDQDKSNLDRLWDVSVGYKKVGDVLVAQGKLSEAFDVYQQSLAIAERLADQNKSNAGWQRDLSVNYNNVGNVLEAEGELPEAFEAYQRGLTIIKHVADQDKFNVGWQQDLAVSYRNVGRVLEAQGKTPEALDAYQQSLNIQITLASQDKSNAGWQRDLASSYEKVGTF
jgi:tetratricopeptide (TPR) repeat protein